MLANGVGPDVAKALNLDRENFPDGVPFRSKAVEPEIKIRNYTHYTPLDRRTTCATCKNAGVPQDLKNGYYRVWCRDAFAKMANAWIREPHSLKDNRCRDWIPRGPDVGTGG